MGCGRVTLGGDGGAWGRGVGSAGSRSDTGRGGGRTNAISTSVRRFTVGGFGASALALQASPP